jgi:hypothetical protein
MTVLRITPCVNARVNTRTSFGTSALLSRLAIAVVAAGVALSLAPAAHAQFGGGVGMRNLFMPDFLGRDLPVFVDSLQLEEWQRPILETLLDEYNATFVTANEGFQAKMKETAVGASQDRVMDAISKPLVEWAAEKVVLREDFLASVKSLLSDVQVEQWPRLERALRREKSLPNGELSGETLNLMMIFRELDAPPSAADAARLSMEEYEAKLDAALALRDAEVDATITPILKAMANNDSQSGIAVQERVMLRRVGVRTVQEESLVAITAALGDEYGAPFHKKAMQRAFPQVYRPDPINPMIDAALGLADLTEAQKTSLETLRAEFTVEYGSLQSRMVDAYRVTEPAEPRRRTEITAQKASGATVKHSEAAEIEMVKKQRDELYTKYRTLLAGLLNDVQKEAIPGMGKPGADIPDGQTYSQAIRSGAKSRGDDADGADGAAANPKGVQAPEFSANNGKGAQGAKTGRDLGASKDPNAGRGGPPPTKED